MLCGAKDERERTMRECSNRQRQQRGFTLIEQIMVLAIMAALTGAVAPPMHALLARNRVQSAQMELIAGLQHARGTAVQSGTRVVFCPSRDASRCSNETLWDGGWLLGTDRNHDNQPDGAPLRVGGGQTRVTIQSTAGRRYVAFQPDGSSPGSNLSIVICDAGGGGAPLSVVVSNAGRVRGASATPAQAAECGRV
jgi:type IV fimbrial biogenesis protein FimT